jgi:dienelactone hydrolase
MTPKQIRNLAWKSLGDLPKFNFIPKVNIIEKKKLDYGLIQKFSFDNKAGSKVFGYFFMPKDFNPSLKYPVVQFIHWHAEEYYLGKDELLKRKSANLLLKKLLASGFLVICIDSYCFGERRDINIKDEESYLAKYNLLYGRTLWGMMLRDELLLLNYIKSLDFVDTKRIGVCGVSMGCMKSLWLASLEDSYKSVVGIVCTVRLQELINAKALNLHGIFSYPFGLLKHFDQEVLYSCINPKNLLLINAEKDPWSPIKGVKYISNYLRKKYRKTPKKFKSILYPNLGHEFTKEMVGETFEWFKESL